MTTEKHTLGSIDRPVFLIGSERSGTTLLRLMLDHHPRIAFCFEFEYAVTQIADDGTYPDIESYRSWLKHDRVFQLAAFNIADGLDFEALLNSFLIQKRSGEGKEIVGATVHYQFHKLRKVWPNARYIYLFRDGRDVAASIARLGWAGNVYAAADWWLAAEQEWVDMRPGLAPQDWIEVRYRDLIANTQSQLRRICEFLGVEYSEKMLNYARTSTYRSPDSSLIEQWRKMPKRDVQLLESKLGNQLLSRGYRLSGYPRVTVYPLLQRYLYLHSRAHSFLFRISQYGGILTLQELLSRRLGLVRLHQRFVSRINKITNQMIQ